MPSKSKKIFTKKKPEKRLLIRLKKRAGRSKSSGRLTVRHSGGGLRKRYRIVDFGQEKINQPGKIIALEYDPNRTAYLMLVQYADGKKSYQLAPQSISIGDEIITAEQAKPKTGNRIKLKNIPLGTAVYNIELNPQKGGQIVRSAGASALILSQEGKYTTLKMPSKEIRKILSECFASIGQISFPEHRYQKLRKAGQVRLKGRRPEVRGTAMNPPDHPHGGGEGRTPRGLPYPKTPWGKPALGVKTRKRKNTDKYIIKRRE